MRGEERASHAVLFSEQEWEMNLHRRGDGDEPMVSGVRTSCWDELGSFWLD